MTDTRESTEPRFIGFDPDDWDEVFHFEVRFARPPPDEVLRWLGTRWTRWWVPAERFDWLFSDAFAAFEFAPRDGREPAAVGATRSLLLELHARAPIVEASFGSLPRSALDGAAPHPVFVEAVREEKARQARAEVQEVLAAAAAHPVKLELVEEPALPAPETYPEWARSWLPTTVRARLLGSITAPYVWLDEHHQGTLPAPLDALPLPEGLFYRKPARIVPRGAQALVALNERNPGLVPRFGELRPPVLCLIADGQVRPFFRCLDKEKEEGFGSYAWLDEEHIVASTRKRVLVIHLARGEEVASARPASFNLVVSRQGRLLVCDSKVFVWTSGALIPAGDNKLIDLAPYAWDEERVVLRLLNRDGPHSYFALTQIDEALATLEPKKKKKKPARKPTPV